MLAFLNAVFVILLSTVVCVTLVLFVKFVCLVIEGGRRS